MAVGGASLALSACGPRIVPTPTPEIPEIPENLLFPPAPSSTEILIFPYPVDREKWASFSDQHRLFYLVQGCLPKDWLFTKEVPSPPFTIERVRLAIEEIQNLLPTIINTLNLDKETARLATNVVFTYTQEEFRAKLEEWEYSQEEIDKDVATSDAETIKRKEAGQDQKNYIIIIRLDDDIRSLNDLLLKKGKDKDSEWCNSFLSFFVNRTIRTIVHEMGHLFCRDKEISQGKVEEIWGLATDNLQKVGADSIPTAIPSRLESGGLSLNPVIYDPDHSSPIIFLALDETNIDLFVYIFLRKLGFTREAAHYLASPYPNVSLLETVLQQMGITDLDSWFTAINQKTYLELIDWIRQQAFSKGFSLEREDVFYIFALLDVSLKEIYKAESTEKEKEIVREVYQTIVIYLNKHKTSSFFPRFLSRRKV